MNPQQTTTDSVGKNIPAQRITSLTGRQWRVIAISQRGLSHETQSLPNQDSYALRILLGAGIMPETIIIAVADGAGSAPLAHIGAGSVASATVAFLYTLLRLDPDAAIRQDKARQALRQAAQYARQVLKEKAWQKRASLQAMATTIQLVVANEHLIATLHIGDGRTVAGDGNDEYFNLSRPYNGEYANETSFITNGDDPLADSNPALQRREISGAKITGIAVSTDGLDPLSVNLSRDEPHYGFYAPAFRVLRQKNDADDAALAIAEVLATPEARRKSPDDITLVMALNGQHTEGDDYE